ncbi:hypothetical protein [Kocuria sabuli]|uniref:hypothetical protein n=1 Tax=Kocuria sabuli TaxID=3071448 RepID=UPI0034D4617A
MAETGATEVGTMTLGEFSRKRDIDSALLRLLADSVEGLSPQARRTVPDLVRVPVVAEAGGGSR